MSENDYAEGSLEWYAWGMGDDYAHDHGSHTLSPLSGEWADGPNPRDIIRAAWQAVMGPSWDTYEHGTNEDRDGDDDILDAWETGYHRSRD